MNPTAIFLIGMPAVGKSSLIQQNGWDTDPNTYIHSTDNIVTEIANRDGITYDEFFASGRFWPRSNSCSARSFGRCYSQWEKHHRGYGE